MCDVADINWLGESILRQEYNELYSFFQKAWEAPYDYIVMIARRCFNLSYVFLQVHKNSGKIVKNENRIISDNALLLYTGEIAHYYARYRRFPCILIADDLAYHGRAIAKLLHDLERLVVSKLEAEHGQLSRDERYYLHKNMVSAIDISIFAVNNQPLLVRADYLAKLNRRKTLNLNALRDLSQQISSFLQKVDMPNTSYSLSFAVSGNWDTIGGLGWSKRTWRYRGAQEDVFFCYHPLDSGAPASQNNFLPTARLRHSFIQRRHPQVWLTGTVLFGKTKSAVFDRVSDKILNELSAQKLQTPVISSILTQKHPLLQKPRAQFISFLLSIVCVRNFFMDNHGPNIPFSLKTSDLDKVCCNFARKAEIWKELFDMDTPATWGRLQSVMYFEFCESANPLFRRPEAFLETWRPQREEDYRAVNHDIELALEQIGMDSEEQAYQSVFGTQHFWSREPNPGVIYLENYLNNIDAAEPDKAACTLMLMDNGLMSMNLSESEDDGNSVVQFQLKAGELATFSTPRHFHIFIPALATVEQEHWRLDLDPQTAVKEFIKSLPDTVEAEGAMTSALMQEQDNLRTLKMDGCAFVERLYSCGHSLNSWNFELVTIDDWRDEGSGSYLAFVQYQLARQDIYQRKAHRFLGYSH